jgi:hypothetical protein
MTFDPYMIVTTNFFEQQRRAGEMMAERDAEMAKVIEKLQAEGYSLKSIHYEF